MTSMKKLIITLRDLFKPYLDILGWITAVIVMIAPIACYMWQFRNGQISNNPADWGTFGDYIGGVYSVIIAFLIVYITRNMSRSDKEREKKREALRSIYLKIGDIQIGRGRKDYKITNLFLLIEEARLYVDNDFYKELKELGNYFLQYNRNAGVRNRAFENSVKERLKEAYDGK